MNPAEAARALIRRGRLIPVVRTDTAAQAEQASAALVDAGILTLEITLTVPGALGCIAALAERYGDRVLIGAGTVLDGDACRAAIHAGARFVVSPACRLDVIAVARRYSAAVLPGALTPTEVLAAWEAGADFVKIFPCDAVGGPAYIKSLRGPFPHIELVPTGGVALETAEAFLRAGATALGLGGNLVNLQDCRAGHYSDIRARSERLRALVDSLTLPPPPPAPPAA